MPVFNLMNDYSVDASIYSVLKVQKIDLVYKIWEIVLLNRSFLIFADSPDVSRFFK